MNHTAHGVVGLGYVGLPLAVEFARSGIDATGVDIDDRKIGALLNGESYVGDVPSSELRTVTDAGLFHATRDFGALREVAGISICVPTPLGKSREPDVSYVVSAAEQLADVLVRGQTVILESTVYPGATEELVAPILERKGMRAGSDFFLAFSPERIDPGNQQHRLSGIPKIVGGVNQESGEKAAAIYRKVFRDVVQVNTTREAEMAKLLENTFRAVNIGLVNELAVIAHGMGIDIWKVVDAAATKPFGFMPFYPGPGWGGHCIPVDPFYLTWRARIDGLESGFIDHAATVNTAMPRFVVHRIAKLLNQAGRSINHSRVLLLGLAYKRDVGDMRESPAIEIADLLLGDGADLSYHDPHIGSVSEHGLALDSKSLTADLLKGQDCVVITTDHSAVDYRLVRDNSKLVFDTRNVMARMGLEGPNVARL